MMPANAMQSADCRCNCKIESWCLPTAVLQWPNCDCCQRCNYSAHSTSWPISSVRRCLWPSSSCSSQHNIQHYASVQAHVRLPAPLTQCVLRDSVAPRVCGPARHMNPQSPCFTSFRSSDYNYLCVDESTCLNETAASEVFCHLLCSSSSMHSMQIAHLYQYKWLLPHQVVSSPTSTRSRHRTW